MVIFHQCLSVLVRLKEVETDVIHGNIYEVSLVLAAANPGAMIESIMQHSDENGDDEQATIWTGTLIHSADDIVEPANSGPSSSDNEDETIQDVIDTMTDKQKQAVEALLGMVADAGSESIQQSADLENKEDQEDPKPEGEEGQEDPKPEDQTKNTDEEEGDGETMKQNVFNKGAEGNNDELKHSINEVLSRLKLTKYLHLRTYLLKLK
jgi:hypothetical protein